MYKFYLNFPFRKSSTSMFTECTICDDCIQWSIGMLKIIQMLMWRALIFVSPTFAHQQGIKEFKFSFCPNFFQVRFLQRKMFSTWTHTPKFDCLCSGHKKQLTTRDRQWLIQIWSLRLFAIGVISFFNFSYEFQISRHFHRKIVEIQDVLTTYLYGMYFLQEYKTKK